MSGLLTGMPKHTQICRRHFSVFLKNILVVHKLFTDRKFVYYGKAGKRVIVCVHVCVGIGLMTPWVNLPVFWSVE